MRSGVGISYLVVVGDLLPDVMKQLVSGGILCERATWVVLTGVFVLLPLASLRYVQRPDRAGTCGILDIARLHAAILRLGLIAIMSITTGWRQAHAHSSL